MCRRIPCCAFSRPSLAGVTASRRMCGSRATGCSCFSMTISPRPAMPWSASTTRRCSESCPPGSHARRGRVHVSRITWNLELKTAGAATAFGQLPGDRIPNDSVVSSFLHGPLLALAAAIRASTHCCAATDRPMSTGSRNPGIGRVGVTSACSGISSSSIARSCKHARRMAFSRGDCTVPPYDRARLDTWGEPRYAIVDELGDSLGARGEQTPG